VRATALQSAHQSACKLTEFTTNEVSGLAGAVQLYEETRDRQRWLEAAAEITAELLDGSDAGDALRLIACRAVELAGADYAVIAQPEEAVS
jgi:hypothetical protein